jgi:hypothetical protein
MNKLTFIEAIIAAVESVRKSQKTFTVSDVFARLRNDVSSGGIAIDKNIQDVTLQEVDSAFQDAMNTGKITFLIRGSEGEDGTSIFFDSNKAAPQNNIETPAKNTEGSLEEKIFFYLDAFEEGEEVTTKMIQSRFKGISKTCVEYSNILESEGYALDKSSIYPSKWFIKISVE